MENFQNVAWILTVDRPSRGNDCLKIILSFIETVAIFRPGGGKEGWGFWSCPNRIYLIPPQVSVVF